MREALRESSSKACEQESGFALCKEQRISRSSAVGTLTKSVVTQFQVYEIVDRIEFFSPFVKDENDCKKLRTRYNSALVLQGGQEALAVG